MLTEKQQAFVRAYVATGGTNATKAARIAGYVDNPNQIKKTAWHLMRTPGVIDAIQQECAVQFKEDLPAAQNLFRQILFDKKHPKQFDALTWYFGVLGISPVAKSEKKIEHSISGNAVERLKLLTQELNIDPARVIDVTPVRSENDG